MVPTGLREPYAKKKVGKSILVLEFIDSWLQVLATSLQDQNIWNTFQDQKTER
jgi:hypothetical protein